MLADSPGLGTEPYLVIAETDAKAPESWIYLAAPYSLEELRADFGGQIAMVDAVEWDAKLGVRAARRESLGALTLSEQRVAAPDADAVRAVLLEALRNSSLELLTWNEGARRPRHGRDGRP